MPTPLRVLFLMEDLCYGGTQRQMLELARRLDRDQFSPSMLTLTGPTDLDAVAKEGNVDVAHLGAGRRVAPLFFARLPFVLRSLRPHVLVPCTALPNIWGRLWGRLRRDVWPRIVGTCRGGGAPVRQHERLLWRLADHMICNSEPLRRILAEMGMPPQRVSCIHNGVDMDFFTPASPPPSARQPLLLCVARLAGDKDHLTLFSAFEELLRCFPEARLRLVGDGPAEGRLRHWADTHAAGARVEFIPGGTDMRPHYAAARMFVLASVREGQPNAILEAMASGLPVCATQVGGIPPLLRGGAGLLSPAGDAAALAANCSRLLADPSLGDAMGMAGRALAEKNFNFTAMVRAHEAVFAHVCAGYGATE